MSGDTGAFDRDDLFLLLEAYKNQIESNQTLLEQQGKIIEQHNDILDKQKQVCAKLSKVLEEIGNHTKEIDQSHIKLSDKIGECAKTFDDSCDDLKDKISSVNTCIVDKRVDCMKDHNKLNIRLYVIYGGITVTIVTLLTLLYNAYEKLGIIRAIATHMGIEIGG